MRQIKQFIRNNTYTKIKILSILLAICVLQATYTYLYFQHDTYINRDLSLTNINTTPNINKTVIPNTTSIINDIKKRFPKEYFFTTSINFNNTNAFPTTKTQSYINPSQWSNCFITKMRQSKIRLHYNHSHDGCLLHILIKNYIQTDILKIFSIHFKREPIIDQFKCGFPITSLKINDTTYYIDGTFYARNHNKSTCLTPHHCQYLDFHFILQHIANIINTHSNAVQWILMLEDDIKLCPFAIDAILSIINDKIPGIKLFYMGWGMTAILIKVDFIEAVLKVLDTYMSIQKPLFDQHHWTAGIDKFLWKWLKQTLGNKYMYNMTSSIVSLTWHPKSRHQSTVGHQYKKQLKCHSRLLWADLYKRNGFENRGVAIPIVSTEKLNCNTKVLI
eukprot:250215_1